MRLLTFAAEAYLALCVLLIAVFATSLAVTEIRWRLHRRRNRKVTYIREWPLP